MKRYIVAIISILGLSSMLINMQIEKKIHNNGQHNRIKHLE